MAEADDMTTTPPENSSSTAADRRETAVFECNICFDLAQDPVITLCGHLHCWPCLYKWLNLQSQSHQCPVCKTLIEEEKLIPLYGRGKPRLIPIQNAEIPHRPTGQRPETAPPPSPESNNLTDIPEASAGFSQFGLSAGFGGVLSPVLRVRFHEFFDATGYGGSSGFNYGSFGEGGVLDRESSVVAQGNDESLKKILVFVLLLVLFDFLAI